METGALAALVTTAATIGTVHTLAGPDHYLPFVAMGRARGWSAGKTAAVTLTCGVGHVAGSVALGAVGIAAGLALGWMEGVESTRGTLAGWLLLGFGIAYTVWGLRRGWTGRPHAHPHAHADGTVHLHGHTHRAEHAHVHAPLGGAAGSGARPSITPWVLFVLFVLGPCEPLIPVLMVPASAGSWWAVALVAGVFGLATLATMTALVLVGHQGLARVSFAPGSWVDRYSHALAGLALVACGLAVQLGL